jgi:cyclase
MKKGSRGRKKKGKEGRIKMHTRRIQWIVVFLFALFISGTGVHSSAQDFAKVQIKTEKITGNTFMLSGGGGNIGVSAGNDGVLMIDASYAPLSGKIKAAIAAVSGKPVRFVVLTHWHQDHTGGSEHFAGEGAVLVSHENVRKRLSTEQSIDFLGEKIKVHPLPESALPVITLKQEVTFHLNGEEIRVFHMEQAHSDGDAVVHFRRSNVIHAGDLYFNGWYPFIDLSAGGSINGMIRAVKKVLALCDGDTKVIPGHGPLSDRAGLKNYLGMLTAVRDRVAREIRRGKILDAVIAARPTRDFDSAWGKGLLKPEQFVTIVYNSLIHKAKKTSAQE